MSIPIDTMSIPIDTMSIPVDILVRYQAFRF